MSDINSITSTVGGRALTKVDLKILKAPEEGGTKKDFEDFLNALVVHVSINWEFGQDVPYILKNTEEIDIAEPQDLSDEEKKKEWKVRLWNQKVDTYGARLSTMEHNKGALLSLMEDNFSKIMRAKMKANTGYTKAMKLNNLVWFLETLDNIIMKFEEVKSKATAKETVVINLSLAN